MEFSVVVIRGNLTKLLGYMQHFDIYWDFEQNSLAKYVHE